MDYRINSRKGLYKNADSSERKQIPQKAQFNEIILGKNGLESVKIASI